MQKYYIDNMNTFFKKNCAGKSSCEFSLITDFIFDRSCRDKLRDRQNGNTDEGESMIHTLSVCARDEVEIKGTGMMISRDIISLIVVSTDVLIMLLFIIAVFRLRRFE